MSLCAFMLAARARAQERARATGADKLIFKCGMAGSGVVNALSATTGGGFVLPRERGQN